MTHQPVKTLNHGWSICLPFSIPVGAIPRLRETLRETSAAQEQDSRIPDLHRYVSDYLSGDGDCGALRLQFAWESATVELLWSGATPPEDQAPFKAIMEAVHAYIFPDGIGFLIAHVRLAADEVTVHEFLKGNNRVRVPEQAAVERLTEFFQQKFHGLGGEPLTDERLPTLAHVAVDSSVSPSAIMQTLQSGGDFFWPGVTGTTAETLDGGELPDGTVALASNLWMRASHRGALLVMSGEGGYVERKFPKRCSGRWLAVYILALHERFALAHFGDLLRSLATKRDTLMERFTFSGRLGRLRTKALEHTALHRLRDISPDERCQRIHGHLIETLQVGMVEEAQDKAINALDEVAGHMYRERMGQVGMVVSAILFPLSLMSMILGMNIAELNPGALASLADDDVWFPMTVGYGGYLLVLGIIMFRR